MQNHVDGAKLKFVDGEDDEDEDDENYQDDQDDQEDQEDQEEPPRGIIREYKFGFKDINMLLEKLPMQLDNFLLKLDLSDGYLSVRTVPGDPHTTAAGVLVQQMFWWSEDPNNRTVAEQPLRMPMDAGMFFSSVH